MMGFEWYVAGLVLGVVLGYVMRMWLREGKARHELHELDEGAELDDVYYERNQAAMLAAKLAREVGYSAGWGIDDKEPEWPVLYIELPVGQVSWHIPMAEALDQNRIMHNHVRVWDGHTVEEKAHRIVQFLDS